MSEKKIKFQSLLHLPSLPSLSTAKKHLLKPLQLSDVIVAMVEEQLSVDKTKQLKSYLTKNRKQTVSLDPEEELIRSSLSDVPEWAKKEWGFTQLLKYHIERKRPSVEEDIAGWQKKLSQIDQEFSNSLEKYKYELEEGKNAIQWIQLNVDKLYETTVVSKRFINQTVHKIAQFKQRIVINVRKQQNLSKTIAIAKAWSKSNISKILSQNLNSIDTLNINQLMQDIDNCSKQIKLQGANKELQNSDKVLKVIEERRNMIIDRVEKNMLFSIVNFTDQEKYQRIYRQYNDLLISLAWSNEEKFKEYHQLKKQNLEAMIQENIDHIYWNSLQSVSTVNNIQLLREETYTAFFSKLVQNYNSYLIKWHKVTSFHVNADTPHKDNCMKMMEDVASKIVKKVFHLIKYSQKFFSLSFGYKIKIILQIDKLVEFLEEWSGKKDFSLFQLMKEKFRTEIDNFRKETNGFLKVLFVEEFSEEGLMPKMKRKSSGENSEDNSENMYRSVGTLVEEMSSDEKMKEAQRVKQIACTKLFQQSFSRTQSPKKKHSHQLLITESTLQTSKKFKQRIRQLTQQKFDISLSKNFVKSIVQYCQREQILPFGHLEYILEHFEFLILLIFKVCVFDETKTKMIESFSERAFQHLKTVETAIEKNPMDESLFHSLARMREAFMTRRNYLQLHHFLSHEIDNKFDNLVISGFVNINKLYLNPQQNTQALTYYHTKLCKMIEQLLKISRWLVNNQSFFSQYEQLTRKLEYLPTVLIQLNFLYFEQYNTILYNKYLETIEPLMKSLKWKIQKFTQETTQQFREYKINILQIYRSSTLNVGVKDKELYDELANKHLELFFKALLNLYCKIDKINDNGRQVLRLDVIQISKILTEVGYQPGSWAVWFEKFIQSTMERSMKNILEKIQQLGIVYPIACWKSPLLWIVHNLSTKEKKQYTTHLLKIYADQLKSLPEL